jgi:hypothetical protein
MALLALALPACGGDDGAGDAGSDEVIAARAWATAVCAEVGDAAADLQQALAVIEQLPDQVEADAPLGDQAGPVRNAFLALPEYVLRYQQVVEETPAPDTADGAAFRQEVLDDLESAARTFGEAAIAAEAIDGDTTVEDFFGGAQAFSGFPEALADSDLDFGEDVPPGVATALHDDQSCIDAQNELISLIGG